MKSNFMLINGNNLLTVRKANGNGYIEEYACHLLRLKLVNILFQEHLCSSTWVTMSMNDFHLTGTVQKCSKKFKQIQ